MHLVECNLTVYAIIARVHGKRVETRNYGTFTRMYSPKKEGWERRIVCYGRVSVCIRAFARVCSVYFVCVYVCVRVRNQTRVYT